MTLENMVRDRETRLESVLGMLDNDYSQYQNLVDQYNSEQRIGREQDYQLNMLNSQVGRQVSRLAPSKELD